MPLPLLPELLLVPLATSSEGTGTGTGIVLLRRGGSAYCIYPPIANGHAAACRVIVVQADNMSKINHGESKKSKILLFGECMLAARCVERSQKYTKFKTECTEYAYIIYLCYNTMPILCNTFMMTGPRLLLLLLLSLLCLSDQAITGSDCKVDSECFNGGTCVKGNASAPSGIQLYVSSLFCFSSLVSSIALHRAFQSYNKKISPVHIKELCLHGSLEWNELPNPLCAVS